MSRSKHKRPTKPADTPNERLEEIVAQIRAVHEHAEYRFTEGYSDEANDIVVALSDRELVSLSWHANARLGNALSIGVQRSKWESNSLVITGNLDEIQFWEDLQFLVLADIDRRMDLPEPNGLFEVAGFGTAPGNLSRPEMAREEG